MTATIPCKAADGFECPYFKICLARRNDKTVTGCGMALYRNGLIKYDQIGIQHTVLKGEVQELSEQVVCNCTDEEIAKSFIEDVEAVKILLPKAEKI